MYGMLVKVCIGMLGNIGECKGMLVKVRGCSGIIMNKSYFQRRGLGRKIGRYECTKC